MNATSAPTQTAETQAALTPETALQMLKDGNARFLAGTPAERDYSEQVNITSGGQHPFAVVLSCIDSRVPAETVFDQGIGDIFSGRVAGNVVNEDQLGSMEYATKVAGSKVVLVMGHTKCGAVMSALGGAELGNITALLSKVGPAHDARAAADGDLEVTTELAATVAEENVRHSIDRIRAESEILAELERNGDIVIAGAMYEVETGRVRFL
jgi:carbonic anhydrase